MCCVADTAACELLVVSKHGQRVALPARTRLDNFISLVGRLGQWVCLGKAHFSGRRMTNCATLGMFA